MKVSNLLERGLFGVNFEYYSNIGGYTILVLDMPKLGKNLEII